MQIIRTTIVALAPVLALAPGGALAQGGASAAAGTGPADVQLCLSCHGPAGLSTLAETPSLAGQPEGFLQWQLVYFRNGVRKSPVMQPIAAALKDNDIRALSAHFARLPPPAANPRPDAADALFAAGVKLAQSHRCAACHKDDYTGTQATARLAGQREDYLLKALRDFKSGVRRGGGVAAMADAVFPLQDEDLRALAHMLASGGP